jgi:hypothetical protein
MTKEMWTMPKKRFNSEEIIHKLREAEVLSSQGRTIVEISRQLGITEPTPPALSSGIVWSPFSAQCARLARSIHEQPSLYGGWRLSAAAFQRTTR